MSEIRSAVTSDAPVGSEKQPEKPADSGNGEHNDSLHSTQGMDITLRSLKARAEVQAIREVLARTGWNRKRAAQLLRISYRGLLYKIQQHNITQ